MADIFLDPVTIVELGVSPSLPEVGYRKIYPKTDGNFYTLDANGFELTLGGASSIYLISQAAALLNTQNTLAHLVFIGLPK